MLAVKKSLKKNRETIPEMQDNGVKNNTIKI